MLDVIFVEDGPRLGKGHAEQNKANIRAAALTMCKWFDDPKKSLARRRKAAAWSNDHLDLLLGSMTL